MVWDRLAKKDKGTLFITTKDCSFGFAELPAGTVLSLKCIDEREYLDEGDV